MHFAEFGVVMMLFLVGLELQPARLWAMRGPVLGARRAAGRADRGGGRRRSAWPFGFDWRMALAAGLILAMSSTAIALQILAETRPAEDRRAARPPSPCCCSRTSRSSRSSRVLPLLASAPAGGQASGARRRRWSALPPWAQALAVLGAVAAVVLGGRL